MAENVDTSNRLMLMSKLLLFQFFCAAYDLNRSATGTIFEASLSVNGNIGFCRGIRSEDTHHASHPV